MKEDAPLKQLLSFKTIRLLNIAEAIIIKEQKTNLRNIALINQCTLKTAEDDLNYLQTHWNHILEIDQNETEISSNNSSCFDFMNLKRNLYQSEIKIQFILSIFFNPNLELGDHAELLNYSDSHLRRLIKTINVYLEPYHTKIEYNPKTFKYKLTHSKLEDHALFMTHLIKDSTHQNLLNPQEKNTYSNYLKEHPNPFINQNNDSYELLFKVIEHSTPDTQEKNKLLQQFKDTHHYYQLQKEIFRKQLITHFRLNDMNITQEDQDTVLEMLLFTTCKATLFPHKVDNAWNRYDFFLETFKKENQSTYKRFILFLNYLTTSHQINYEPYKSELAFNLYTMIDSLKQPTHYKIGIYSDLGYSHARSLVNTYQHHFSNHKIEIYEETRPYDLILSTHSHINTNQKDKIIKVSDKLKLSDIKKIHQFISRN